MKYQENESCFKIILPLLIAIITISSYIGLEISAPSLPYIKKFFNISERLTGMIITIHFLGIFIMSFFYGPISDSIGRKKVLIFGIIVAALGCLISFLSTSISILIFGRFIHGLGSAAIMTMIPVMISESYSAEKATNLFRINSGILTIFSAIAPTIGGFINNIFSWRGNFSFLFILQVISLILIYLFFKDQSIKTNKNISIIGIFRKYLQILKTKNFIRFTFIPMMLYTPYLGFINYAAFLYIQNFGLNDIGYSIHQGLMIACFALTNIIFGLIKYNRSLWEKKLIYSSSIIIFFSYGMMFFVRNNEYFLTALIMLALIGHAILSPIFFAKIFSLVEEKGSASSLVSIIRSISTVFFTWLASFIYNGSVFNIALILFSSYIIVLLLIFKEQISFKKIFIQDE